MNIQAWENRQWFERIMALKAQHDPNRVVPADDWVPDTSMLDLVTLSRQHVVARPVVAGSRYSNPHGLARVEDIQKTQQQTDDWYRGA